MKIERYVLIIDDDQDFVHLTSVYLKRSGYRTSVQPLAAPAARHLSGAIDSVATMVCEREAAIKEALQRERSHTLEVELSEMPK